MIDEARTLELFGYTSDSLAHGSHKKVCAVCDKCGKVRIVRYEYYSKLCHRCSVARGENHYCYGTHLSEETKLKLSDAQRGEKGSFYGKHHSEETKRKIGERKKGKTRSKKTRQKLSDANKGNKHTNESKQKMSDSRKGEKNHAWQGGISFEPYCPKFNEAFKESIREKFGRICFLCPKTEVENGVKLCVHHVNYNKDCLCDDVKCEFVPLCVSCHAKTNFNQEYWENLIMEKLKDNSQLLDQFRNK